ncbi:Hypothetical predicted protein [Podarcis lilfordi]|uniref:Uncharacterized protein n=1 Tax=Podarcis lilfordi TaxID=74358 RepID=A0AA35K467_9SAUR|nr:Hypothetical predicted protein [Podarcis lilfordi]
MPHFLLAPPWEGTAFSQSIRPALRVYSWMCPAISKESAAQRWVISLHVHPHPSHLFFKLAAGSSAAMTSVSKAFLAILKQHFGTTSIDCSGILTDCSDLI